MSKSTSSYTYESCCCCSVTQLCPTLCNPTDCSTPGLPVPHCLPEFAQVHVHCIGDAVQPSRPLMPSSPSALNSSQHQGLFQWVICLHQMTKIVELQLSPSSEYSGLISLKIGWFDFLAVQGSSRGFSRTTVWRHQFFGILSPLWSSSHNWTWPLGRP